MTLRVLPLRIAAALLLLLACLGLDTAPTAHRTFTKWAVAADHPLASAAGAEVLRQGGTAADAAAATMLSLGVVSSASSGLGGGGFALYYRASDKTLTFLDFREMAPSGATVDMFKDQVDIGGPVSKPSQYGGLASGVMGEPAGIDELLRRFGKVPRKVVVAPALRYASQGFDVRGEMADVVEPFADQMLKDPTLRKWFEGSPPKLKKRLKLPELARTLRAFAAEGSKPFYDGAIAREIVKANRARGGIFTLDDLKAYKVVERKPLEATRFGYRWVSSPPPSAGGYTMLASLALLERWLPKSALGKRGPAMDHAFAESWKGPYLDRMQYLGDPDFVDPRIAALLDERRIDQRAKYYRPTLAMDPAFFAQPLPDAPARPAKPVEDHGTSHLCVVDAEGNIAAVTTTVNLSFGARYTAAGIVMNDQMDDFASDVGQANAFGLVGGTPNLPAPGKRPLSSMSPTIVFDADGPVLCAGASGGSRIITATEQVVFHTLIQGWSLEEAVRAPRVHHQAAPNRVRIENDNRASLVDLEQLQSRGHVFERSENNAVVQAIHIDRKTHALDAMSDPRKGGEPAGD